MACGALGARWRREREHVGHGVDGSAVTGDSDGARARLVEVRGHRVGPVGGQQSSPNDGWGCRSGESLPKPTHQAGNSERITHTTAARRQRSLQRRQDRSH